jgi:uncharacterized protein with HEPN domain
VKAGAEANVVLLALAVEHLRAAVRYARRGRRVFFSASDPDSFLLTEAELRKGFESLNRMGAAFRAANPKVDWERVGEIRQELTHDYAALDREHVWTMATLDAPQILHRLSRAKLPRTD